MTLQLVLGAIGLMACSGVAGLGFHWRSRSGPWIGALLSVLAAAAGVAGAFLSFGRPESVSYAWPGLPGVALDLEVDALSGMFLVPVFIMTGLGAIYSLRYWGPGEKPRTARQVRFLYGFLGAGMALLVVARDAFVFLVGWEIMTFTSFFLVTTEDRSVEARKAGWLYLMMSHIAIIALYALFGLFYKATGSFHLRPLGVHEVGLGTLTIMFFLILLGFGVKAGLMPLHVWLPGAHAAAPSHVSALMSGVVIKMGVYGLVRFLGYLPNPPASWGGILLFLGVVSGVGGVLFAIGQHDLKRLLAYHSIENIGIIVMGLGLAMLGRSLGRPDLVLLGMAGCLLHVWNHGLFKALLFFGAGSVIHAVGTREIDRMGGLAKRMPRTALMFLIGAVAICGLPPLNGFVSELFVYLGLFRGPASAAAAAPALALIGALAVACFVKVYGAVFLGEARTPEAARAHEAPAAMIAPMVVLALACVAIGVAPAIVVPALEKASGAKGLAAMAPLHWVSIGSGGLLVLVILGRGLFARAKPTVGTWDCGYLAPTPRIQYTSSSFAEMLVKLWRWVLRPKIHRPKVEGEFPAAAHFDSHVGDTVLEGVMTPAVRAGERQITKLRWLQQGSSQRYILYILVVLVGLLLWSMPLDRFIVRIFSR